MLGYGLGHGVEVGFDFLKNASLEYVVALTFIMNSVMGTISSSLSSWRHLAMVSCIWVIISRSSSGIADVVGSPVGVVE
eukprot:3055002-Ditylum_brightwellii.AAC.1